MMVGDVTVVGIDPNTTVLYDIGMDVPHRGVVTISADKATLSKDLWRAISQRRIFQLHAGSVSQGAVRPTLPTGPNLGLLQEKCRRLEAENADLLKTIEGLRRELATAQPAAPQSTPDPKLDEILALLRAGIPVVAVAGTSAEGRSAPVARTPMVVEVDVPAFIPNEIKPKSVEGRITDIQAETSENSNLGSAADALRKLRGSRQ